MRFDGSTRPEISIQSGRHKRIGYFTHFALFSSRELLVLKRMRFLFIGFVNILLESWLEWPRYRPEIQKSLSGRRPWNSFKRRQANKLISSLESSNRSLNTWWWKLNQKFPDSTIWKRSLSLSNLPSWNMCYMSEIMESMAQKPDFIVLST